MNDRFKFRAWYCDKDDENDSDNNKMFYNAQDTYDCLGGNPPLGASSFGDIIDDECWVVEQCTGIKDKNGKLIYEGDVVQMSYPYSSQNKYIVKWGDCCWELWLKNGFVYVIHEKMSQSMEVIGNIHENADLLEYEE